MKPAKEGQEGSSNEKFTRYWKEFGADGLVHGAGHIDYRFFLRFRHRHLGSPAAMVE